VLASPTEALLVERQLSQALAGTEHSLVDVSHRDMGFALLGPKTTAALNAGCPLDLHPSVFAAGMCTRTLVGKAQVVLWRLAVDSFQIHTFRSFADYVWRFLEQAAADLA
jgi:sarcosine oxidase, subunit gamma